MTPIDPRPVTLVPPWWRGKLKSNPGCPLNLLSLELSRHPDRPTSLSNPQGFFTTLFACGKQHKECAWRTIHSHSTNSLFFCQALFSPPPVVKVKPYIGRTFLTFLGLPVRQQFEPQFWRWFDRWSGTAPREDFLDSLGEGMESKGRDAQEAPRNNRQLLAPDLQLQSLKSIMAGASERRCRDPYRTAAWPPPPGRPNRYQYRPPPG